MPLLFLQEFLFQGGSDGSLGDGGAVVIDADGANDGLIPFGGDGSTGGHSELAINHPEGAQGSNGNAQRYRRMLLQGCEKHTLLRYTRDSLNLWDTCFVNICIKGWSNISALGCVNSPLRQKEEKMWDHET